ncbi:MAG: response regulator transcription factor [Chitinophagales bacterium]
MNSAMPIKILIADDHKLFRTLFVGLVNSLDGISVIGEAADGNTLLDLVRSNQVDVILLDLKMPNMDGFEVLSILRNEFPSVRNIVISSFETESHILHAIEKGARGYLDKDSDPVEIENAIRSVYETGFYFNDHVNKSVIAKAVNGSYIKPHFSLKKSDLSDIELSILQLLCQELTSEEISKRIFRSKRTVENIRNTLLQKIGVRNVTGLVVYAIANNLCEF